VPVVGLGIYWLTSAPRLAAEEKEPFRFPGRTAQARTWSFRAAGLFLLAVALVVLVKVLVAA
jgi:hypothetical protein